MLKKFLSVSGKSGLFKLISQGKNMFIAESLLDGRRIPVYSHDKVASLGDISIYTNEEEVPLSKVLTSIKQKENGEAIPFSSSIQPKELCAYFAEVLPNYDKQKVYPSDIKKIMNWYNLLLKTGITDFEKEEEAKESAEKKEEENN